LSQVFIRILRAYHCASFQDLNRWKQNNFSFRYQSIIINQVDLLVLFSRLINIYTNTCIHIFIYQNSRQLLKRTSSIYVCVCMYIRKLWTNARCLDDSLYVRVWRRERRREKKKWILLVLWCPTTQLLFNICHHNSLLILRGVNNTTEHSDK